MTTPDDPSDRGRDERPTDPAEATGPTAAIGPTAGSNATDLDTSAPSARLGPMHRRLALVAGAPLLVLFLLVVGWLIFGRSEDGRVVGNVELAGVDIGGMSAAEVGTVVDRLAADLLERPVTVATADGDLDIDPLAIHLVVDREEVTAAALESGRDGPGLLRPVTWLWRTVSPAKVPVVVELDREALAEVVAAGDPTGRLEPLEPTVTVRSGALVATEGVDGRGLRPGDVADAIAAAAETGRRRIDVRVAPATLPPRFDDEAAAALLVDARRLTAAPLDVRVGDVVASIPVETQQGWITTHVDDAGRLALELSGDHLVDDLVKALGDVGAPAGDATLEIRDDRPVLVPGTPGTRCCGPEVATVLFDAMGSRPDQPVELPLTVREPDRTNDELTRLGIVEKIGEFTTRHAAGESRVVNIHRIADLVRGQVIEPGATFSVNEFVGRRTADGGFVTGGVIQNGVFTSSVGGGISQFATTLFNAAFFGGLDFQEYQSHSIYISRYPYGREATLSYPKPDLVLENTTPHGVLIWTEYTSTSITVTLWSTRYASGEQTGQTATPNGRCTRVRTERTRTYVDGRTAVDSVVANYRPGEGVAC